MPCSATDFNRPIFRTVFLLLATCVPLSGCDDGSPQTSEPIVETSTEELTAACTAEPILGSTFMVKESSPYCFGISKDKYYGGSCGLGYVKGECMAWKDSGHTNQNAHCEAKWASDDPNDCRCKVHLGTRACDKIYCDVRITRQSCGEACGTTCPPQCGDGICNGTETCSSCSTDCGSCPPAQCGDGKCNGTETCESCSRDCGSCKCTNNLAGYRQCKDAEYGDDNTRISRCQKIAGCTWTKLGSDPVRCLPDQTQYWPDPTSQCSDACNCNLATTKAICLEQTNCAWR